MNTPGINPPPTPANPALPGNANTTPALPAPGAPANGNGHVDRGGAPREPGPGDDKRRPERHNEQNRHEGEDENAIPKDLPRPGNVTVGVAAVAFVLLLVGLFLVGWFPHHRQAEEAKADAAEKQNDTPVVSTVWPRSTTSSKDLVLPADVKANQEADLYPRANGYLNVHLVDIGDHVKEGQPLAEIETPEVDAQLVEANASLEQSKTTVAKAQADEDLAKHNYQRYVDAQKNAPGSVTQQDVDTNRAAYNVAVQATASARASVGQQEAAVHRLEILTRYEKMYAPFSGVITARNYDKGALLNPADTAPGHEMFHIAQTDTLRVFVSVPQAYATTIRTGQSAYLSVRNYPGREFEGSVARTAGALDQNTRTIAYELHFNNQDGALKAGMYGQARLLVTQNSPVWVIPSSALVFNSAGTQVAVVKDGHAHFQPITVGRDLGTELEVATGLTCDDQVVSNPGERLAEGVAIEVHAAGPKPAAEGAPGARPSAGPRTASAG